MKDKSQNDEIVKQAPIKENLAQNQSPGIDESRRSLTKAGFAAPALITLASRPVFGAQCLSEMMSGNMSQAGDQCGSGWSPGAWRNPGGTIDIFTTKDAWEKAGFFYSDGTGEDTGRANPCGNGHTSCAYFAGGTLLSETTLGSRMNITAGSADDAPMREILCCNESSDLSHCITAYLNASLSENSASTFKYILAVWQVLDLCDETMSVPLGYGSLNTFFDSTWS